MKKLLFTGAVALFAFTASAQFDQGAIHIAGATNLGVNSTTTTFEFDEEELDGETKHFSFNFSPRVGLAIADGFIVGLKIDFSSSKSTLVPDEGDDFVNRSGHVGVGPYVRYYIGDSGLFGKAELCFGSMSTEDDFLNEDFEVETGDKVSNGFLAWEVGVGFTAWLNDNIGISPCLGFGGMTVNGEAETLNEDFEEVTVDTKEKTTGIMFGVVVDGLLD